MPRFNERLESINPKGSANSKQNETKEAPHAHTEANSERQRQGERSAGGPGEARPAGEGGAHHKGDREAGLRYEPASVLDAGGGAG